MTVYDLCLAWNWPPDADFVALLDAACRSRDISLLQAISANLEKLLQALASGEVAFCVFFDRASDNDAHFNPLVQWAREHAAYRINPHEQARRTWDKAAMHAALINGGLYTPHTIVLPPYAEQPALPPVDLSPLGPCFTIKPAHGGGGEGVVTEATSLEQALAARQEHPADHYLLQAHIVPVMLGSHPAWFRVIYCTGQVYPCWWDTRTHAYIPVTAPEEALYNLARLREIAAAIARLSGLDLFSTEVSLTAEGLYVVVDYVNDQIDLRLQSKTCDGVPDAIVRAVAERLAALVAAHRPPTLEGMAMSLKPIGVVRSPVTEPVDEGWGAVVSEIHLHEALAAGLQGLEQFSHIVVIFLMHESTFDPAEHLVRRPQGRTDMPELGIFAQRAKHRPNPIGITVVERVSIERNVLKVRGLDAIDGTPVLDIKPYFPAYDRVEQPLVPEWVAWLMDRYF
jgi:tRNA-Thr(GGU) m(6)t(6)A37 methyltransferase TsaA